MPRRLGDAGPPEGWERGAKPGEKGRPDKGRGDRGARRAEREERIEELKTKAAGGTLTPAEEEELEKAERLKKRFEDVAEKRAAREANRPQRADRAREQATRELAGLRDAPAALAEQNRHAERMAKLERARELAEAGERTELLEKIDQLTAQESARHAAWLEKQRGNEK